MHKVYRNVLQVTPANADLVDAANVQGVYVGSAGNLRVITKEGTDVTLPVLAGSYHPLAVRRIISSPTPVFALYN